MILLVFTFAAILSLSCTLQTPDRQLGYLLIGDRTKEIFIDLFYDNICADSAANWPLFSQVMSQEYLKDTLGVAVHIYPLPYHHNSFFAAWAGEAVKQSDASKYPAYMTYVFKNYDNFISKAVNLTEGKVHQAYASAVEISTGIKAQVILDGYKNRELDLRARLAWKYGCYRGVSGTPTFMVNDVVVPEAGGFSLSQWNSFLRKLLE